MTGSLRLRSEHLTWQTVDGDVIALDGVRSEYLSVEGSGTMLWEALAHGTTPQELAQALGSRYGLRDEQARHDVERFLDELRDAGLLDAAA